MHPHYAKCNLARPSALYQACLEASRSLHARECASLAGLSRLGVEGESQAMRLALSIAAIKVSRPSTRF